jgi:hypothetical protein
MIVWVERGVDLLALEKLMATLRDWFVTCHASVPAVFRVSVAILVCRVLRGIAYPEAWCEHAGCDD